MKVLSLIDSLIAAGAERMAVNIANGLADAGIESHLCATHSGGPLTEFVEPKVPLLILNKLHTFDFLAFFKLKRYVRKNGIKIIHAHSSSIFWAVMLKWTGSRVKVVWHDHYGFSEHLPWRKSKVLRLLASSFAHAFVVNDKLLKYAVEVLKIHRNKVSFLANFADIKFENNIVRLPEIPDIEKGPKLVCLANLRPQKDHHNLLDAFSQVLQQYPDAVLYLVGGHFNDEYYHSINDRVNKDDNLKKSVHILGSRNDVAEILRNCDLGLLSSLSEGLPVSLLEYGLAGLAVVCTDVGDCAFVLDGGSLGSLVEASNPNQLADAIISLLDDSELMKKMGKDFEAHIKKEFSKDAAIKKILDVYKSVI